ncbi:DUF4446 family protein [Candidatus Dojkabacteria bacterium]|nr:DUF4446 family protein [Candidatus Dojkabacteria bacterium]
MEITSIDIIVGTVSLLLLGLTIFLTLKIRSISGNYNQLTKEVEGKNLEELLKEHLKRIDKQSETISTLQQELSNFKKSTGTHIQKVSFKRFNPFHETGGDQSFILVLLDRNDNGIILSSLHQRELTRIYAKEIKNGKCENKLSEEEIVLLKQAQRE